MANTTIQQLISKAIELETQINTYIVSTQRTCPQAARAAEHASDSLAHNVIEWLRSAQNRERECLSRK